MDQPHSQNKKIAGAILAGGKSRRMGQNKANIEFQGRPLALHVIDRLGPQVPQLLWVGDVKPPGEAESLLKTLHDAVPGRRGPLAGILTALEWAASDACIFELVQIATVDMPFLPDDLTDRLRTTANPDCAAIPTYAGGRLQPLAGLWPVSWAPSLRTALERSESLSVRAYLDEMPSKLVDFASGFRDPFVNINTPEDLARAENSEF